jgi:hypothetical protein
MDSRCLESESAVAIATSTITQAFSHRHLCGQDRRERVGGSGGIWRDGICQSGGRGAPTPLIVQIGINAASVFGEHAVLVICDSLDDKSRRNETRGLQVEHCVYSPLETNNNGRLDFIKIESEPNQRDLVRQDTMATRQLLGIVQRAERRSQRGRAWCTDAAELSRSRDRRIDRTSTRS